MNDDFEQLNQNCFEGNVDERIYSIRKLLSVGQQSGNKVLEAEALRRLGNAYQEKGQLQKAHNYRLVAYSIVEEIGDRCPGNIRMMIEGDLGRSFIEAKDWKQAAKFTSSALERASLLGNLRARLTYLMNQGLIIANEGPRSPSKVDEVLRLANEVIEEGERLNDHYLLGRQHLNLAFFFNSLIRLNDALRHARKALAHAELANDEHLRLNARRALADVNYYGRMMTGRSEYSEKAEDYLLEVLEQAKSVGDSILQADSETRLAELYETQKRFDEAAKRYQFATTAWEQVRTSFGYEEFQSTYFKSVQTFYDRMIEFHLRRGELDAAFSGSEHMRSRMLLATVGGQKRKLQSWSTPEREDLTRELDHYGRAALQGLGKQKKEARTRIADLFKAQRSRNVNLQVWQSPPIAQVDEIRKNLGPDAALLAYVVTRESLIVFVVTTEGFHFQHLNYPLSKLRQAIGSLTDEMRELDQLSVDDDHRRVREQLSTVNNLLEKLFAILIAPILPTINPKKHWVVVPQGPLHQVPFAALRFGEAYLIERHSISFLPSASLGVILVTRPSLTPGIALFFANPDSHNKEFELPGSEKEVAAGWHALRAGPEPFVGKVATKAILFEHIANARLLHLACHYVYDRKMPMLSFLKLAGDRGSEFVYCFELDGIEFSTELVTLSACDSGLSKTETGDEQYGMVRTLLGSGARSVLSTLWRIEDNSAAQLFAGFYPAARELGLAQALALAQRRLLRHPYYSLPNFWAPYVLSGEWKNPLSCLRFG